MAGKQQRRGQLFTAAEILHAVRMMHLKHGEPLTYHRFCRYSGVPGYQVYQHFKSWHDVREQADLPRVATSSRRIPEEAVLEVFDSVVRKLRRFPTPAEFERLGSLSYHTLWRRIGGWPEVRRRYSRWLKARASSEPRPEWDTNPQRQSEPERDVAWIRNAWCGLRVGFELQSRHFEGRNPCECDLLIVLHHDWQQCPVPVLELGAIVPAAES
ncbi:MAG: hypothetical protein SH850_09180 [Planctomycetaceae bacterium]|nr:hypothetical protein [Planctomycetaceae bacterium]